MSNVVFVRGDGDWQGLYVDDKLELQNHSLRVIDVLKLLNGKVVESFIDIYMTEEQQERLDDERYYPNSYDEFLKW